MTHEITVLSNGLRVVAVPMKERRSVAIGLWVHVGGRHETLPLGGVSHFLEHVVFKGTKKRTTHQIKESIEGVGGSMNAFTGEEYTCFLAKIARRHFDEVFDVLSDMVLDASITTTDVEKERTVIMEEIKMTQDQPGQLAEEILSEIVWPDHPLGRPLAGTLETVAGLSRDDIVGYRDRYYQSNFITVVAAGDIDQKTLLKVSETRFKGGRTLYDNHTEFFKQNQKKPVVRMHSKSTEQTHLSLALH